MNVLIRVDDRLIHGQVIHGWMPKLDATVIIIADTHLAEHPEEHFITRLAAPPETDVIFVSPTELSKAIDPEKNTIILFKTPTEVLLAINNGFQIERLNLGNLHFEEGKVQIRKTFCCNKAELTALQSIKDHGVDIVYRPAPDQKGIHLDDYALSG